MIIVLIYRVTLNQEYLLLNKKFSSRKPIKKIEEVTNIIYENEWGIQIEESSEETVEVKKKIEIKDTSQLSVDDLKNQLGNLFKK